ncbi:MAG TPA: 4Fe-4S binding protein, partial [bacterium]|nr:4Fe-4S binding protein [bacterium]
VTGKILSYKEVDRRRLYMAYIDQEKCNQCNICYKACYSGAIEKRDGRIYVNSNCVGCGLCAELCPRRAIELVGL